jgi:chromosome segregation ATPase
MDRLSPLPDSSKNIKLARSSAGDAAHPLADLPDDTFPARRPDRTLRQSAQDIGQRAVPAAADIEQARADAHAWETRARESERARERIARRMDAARRDVYDANQLLEQAEIRAEQAEERTKAAEARAEQAEARAQQAEARAKQAEANSDALLSSTAWRITSPLRKAGQRISPGLRRALRQAASLLDIS